MKLIQLTQKFDKEFNIQNIPPDMPFSKLIPKIYEEVGLDYGKYIEKNFINTFHGLMIKNSEEVSKVYLTVFLSEEILDKIFNRGEKDILIFSHHPMDMETNNRGFLPLSEKYFKDMREKMVSVYSLHTPLDIHEKISTSISIADSLALKKLIKYHKNSIGFSGVTGELEKEVVFDEFIYNVQKVFNIKEIHYIKNKMMVGRIGIIAGGGSNPKYIEETKSLGCDTYLTGEYVNRINNEYGTQQKKEFEELKPSIDINLIECSHYATEKIVLRKEIRQMFNLEGIDCEFMEQDNPWK